MLIKTFYICTYRDGRQYPIMRIHPKKYEMLYELAFEGLSTSVGVKKAIEQINLVQRGEIPTYLLSGGDLCIVEVNFETSLIRSGFDLFDPLAISTIEIESLMNEWYDFLIAYESGNIPGIKPPIDKEIS